jgi:hypothetical protein
MFDESFSIGALGYQLIRQYIVTVPSASSVHVYGRPDSQENCFTSLELHLPAEAKLYVIDTSGLWKLVAYPGDDPGPFVGWIRMDSPAWLPGVHSPAVAAIVLKHPHTR